MSAAAIARPAILPPDMAGIPVRMRDEPRWIVWRYEWIEDKQRWNKTPYDPKTNRMGSSTDPRKWADFEAACWAYESAKHLNGKAFSGIGFVLGDGWVGVDIDGCRDAATGLMEPWASRILAEVPGFAEVSVSGTGVHVICCGSVPPGRRERDDRSADHRGVAIYDQGRYFALTGVHVDSAHTDVEDATARLASLHARLFPAKQTQKRIRQQPASLPDGEILTRARRARNGAKFSRLWEGYWEGDYSSQSEADLALCTILIFWSGGDANRVDSLFRESGLMRPKWSEARRGTTYGWQTIERAIELTDTYYEPGTGEDPPDYREQAHDEPEAADDTPVVKEDEEFRPSVFDSMAPYPQPIGQHAHRGIAGAFVRMVEPHTEADSSWLLLLFLAYAGNIFGRNVFLWAGGDKHYGNLFVCGVGPTSQGRKGSAFGPVEMFFEGCDDEWLKAVQSGLSSGEGLIWCVRDPIIGREKKGKRGEDAEYADIEMDPGIRDKRLLVRQSEFFGALSAMRRQGNTLSPVIRDAWDKGYLNSMVKNSPAKATGAHISICANITREELLRTMTSTEADNGFANRFLWACSIRSKVLPEGGKLWQIVQSDEWKNLQRAFNRINISRDTQPLLRSTEANEIWGYDDNPSGVYAQLTSERNGLYGAVTARAAPNVLRLSLIYALLDGAAEIGREHLEAALEVWRYCDESAKYIFGDATGDTNADSIMQVLRKSPEGMTRTELRDYFSRNMKETEMDRALMVLHQSGMARFEKVKPKGKGRPAERWMAVRK